MLICKMSGKVKFAKRVQAERVAAKLAAKGNLEVRTYYHRPCAGWHITSRPMWGKSDAAQ